MKRIFLVLSMFSVITVSAQKKVVVAKGQQIEQTSKMTMNMTQEMMGQQMEIKMGGTTVSTVDIKDVSASGFVVVNTIKNMKLNVSAMGNEQNFDSDKKEDLDGPMGQNLKNRLNVPMEYKLDQQGTVLELPASQSAGGGVGGLMSGAEEMMKGQTFTSFIAIPSSGLKVGDVLKDSAISAGTATRNSYTVKSVNGKEAVLDLTGTMSLEKEMEQQGMQMVINMNSKATGEVIVDSATGIIKSRKQNIKSTGSIEVAGQSVPLTADNTMEVVQVVK